MTQTMPSESMPIVATGTLLISELYASIQGESTYAGMPCTFVRLTGCPLRCVWCDTEYSFVGGTRRSIESIIAEVNALQSQCVEVTGGEPLAQPECINLLRVLCDGGHRVLLETSGALPLGEVDPRVIKIVDIKCPGSGESDAMLWENLACLQEHDEVKFVIADRADFDYAERVIRERHLEHRRVILFSPVHGKLPPHLLAEWIIVSGLPVRLQLQMHKYVWPDRKMGV